MPLLTASINVGDAAPVVPAVVVEEVV
jgi:hypothetical protein